MSRNHTSRRGPLVAAALAGSLLFACAAEPGAGMDAAVPDSGAGDDASASTSDLSATAPLDLLPPEDLASPTGPSLLSQTGLYSDIAKRTLAPGVFRYAPRYPLWSDGADKDRYLWLPAGTQIDTSQMDHWTFPIGSKFWKEFRKDGVVVETRLLQKQWNDLDGWIQVSYAWRGDDSDADAVPKGLKNARGTTHEIPASTECFKCHDGVRDKIIGVSAFQLSPAAVDFDGGAGDDTGLSALLAAHLLSAPPTRSYEVPGAGVTQQALAYLHGNCGHCHNYESHLHDHVLLVLRLYTDVATPEETPTWLTSIGARTVHVYPPDIQTAVVPGAPERSQLYVRTGVRDFWAMPPNCTNEVDVAGRATIAAWIKSLH